MVQIDKYEIYRTIACLIIGITTIIETAILYKFIENDTIALCVVYAVGFIGCFLINLVYKICDKKIEKYKKDNAKELSFDSSQL